MVFAHTVNFSAKNASHFIKPSVQYYGIYVCSYNDKVTENSLSNLNSLLSNQRLQYQDGITLRFMKSWYNDKVKFELKSNFGLEDNGVYIAPKISYVYNNRLTFNLGADYFDGSPTNSYLGQFSGNKAGYLEGRLFF